MDTEKGAQRSDRSKHVDGGDERGVPVWEISKHLLDAHSRSGEVLEQYLLVQELEGGTADDELRVTIEQAIQDHEQIIEELEAALEKLSVTTE